MPLDNSKLKKVYATLQQGGYKQDYKTFLKGFTGNDHYENRKKVYDLLSANGARIGSSYEEFMKKMQVAPAPAKSTPAKPKGTPITEAYRQKVLANVGNMMAETNASIQRTQNRMDYARANAGLRVPRVTIGDKNSGVRLGQNTKVVAKKPQYNPKSGKMEQTYITESGNEFTDRGAADLEQNTIDAYKDSMSVSGQLRDAYAERDRLDEAMKKRMKEIDERPNQRFNDFMRESAAAMTPGAGPAGELEARMSKYDNDDEYLQLMAAARKNHQTIQLLEDKKNNQMNSFWHSLGTTALNGYTFTDGMSEMRDATALTRASKHIDSINRKRAAGKPLTREEQTAEAVLKNFATDNAVQGMYGGDYGAWARAGGMTANSLDFMKDLMLNPGAGSMAKGIMRGTAKGMAKGLAKVTGKEAAQLWKNNVVRRTLKATGVLIGAHTAGAYVSNTTGIGRTAATMGTLASGKVGVDDNGNYMVENAMGLLPAFAEAERQQARENGSEMFGEFIPGVGGMVKKGLEKIGLSKLSGAMTNIGNKEWYKQYSRLLESGGYNGLPGEALEEYEGSLFDALTGHAGDAWDDMTNLQNHVDIWLGCATMGALLGSVPMMMHGHHTALYYRYKHNTDKADNLASFRMTAERWAPLHDKIDNTDNSKMADVVTGIINNPDLHPEEKKAALNYVRNLTMMRGYNIAQVNNASDDEEQRPEVQSVNDNYSKGYDTTEPQAMNDAKNLLDMKREQVAKEHGIENVDEVDALIGDDPLRYIEEQKQLGNTDKLQSVIDYANAKSAYDGMVQRVQDDIDSRIEETNATVDSRVNRHDGMIHPASLKLQNEDGTDKKVYIVSGNVVMFDDGKGVDREKSDNTIVIRDVETGEMKVIPPDLIRGLDAAVDPEEEKARAREAIIEEMSQTAANNVDGVVSFNEGDTYTLTDENGEQTQVTLVANEQGLVDNGDGTVNVTVDGQNVVPMSMEDIQGGVDATNMARTVQAEQERQANGENVPNSDESVQNDGENVQETPDGVEYGVNDTFTFIDGEGATIHGEVQGISDDGVEIRTDEPLNGKRVQVIPVEEFENNVESINDADGNQVWAREYAEDAAATEEVSDSTEPLDHDLVAPATPTTEELVQMARGGNELAQHQLEAQGVEWEEPAKMQQTSLSRVPINEETGEPMFEKADRETALDALNEVTGGNDENTTAIVRAQVEQATKALEALKKKEPTKKTPSLKGSPMAMVKAQQEAEANYNTAMEDYNAQVAAAEENLNAWSRINSLMNDRKRAIREQQEAERKAREEKLHAEAVARLEEDKRIAAEKAAEQEAVGTHAVNPKIKAKWDGATKVEGNPNAITLADGSTIRGHYVLTEAGAATASHDVNNAYEPTEGFPVDENGESVNDRDYKRDKDAQRIVRDMADSYDSRALQTPVIVSKDGVVLSGNNRTMSGEIAAKNGTDKAYVDHLREFGAMFGFTPEQIDGMQHPRVVFVPDEELPYDASTFARFNAEQQKKQSKPEHAVKLGKIVPDNVFTSITNDISRFDRMSDYYADDRSVASAISQLLDAGVINEMQLPELRTGNALSAAGKELIENTLIGKVFQTSPDAVRQIISTPTLRQSVVMGLNEIANNRTLAKSGYDLSKELAAAVDLVSRAKSDSPEIYKEGMPVSPYGRQQGLFDDEYGDSRVTDGVTLLLADLLNSGKPSDLRKVLSTYNNEAASPAAGQIDMFSGDVTSKEEILKNVIEYFRNATPKEQQALIDAAVAERKRRAEAAEPAGGDEASEQATVVAESDAEPQQPVVASEEPVKGNEPDADALAKEAEEKLSERITDTEDEWTEPSEYGEIYKHRMFVDGKEVIKVDAPDKSKNYPGTYYEIDGKQFGDLYEDGINKDAVAALPEDTAIQLHVVDILNPGMTDHSMKSKIESLNTLLPKISDKKLSELDKEYGDDKDMGTHIKAEVARRENEGIFKKAERIAKEAKTEREKTPIDNNGFGIYQKAYDDFIDGIEHKGMLPNVKALKNMVTKAKRRLGILEKGAAVGIKNDEDLKHHEKAVHELINMRDAYQAMLDYVNKRMKASEVKTSKVKPEQPVGDLFAGLFDEPNNNETADSNSSSPSQTVAGAERPDTVGIDETGTDGAERTTAVAGTDGERSTDASRENGREAADGAVHGTDEVGGIQPPVGNRGRDESAADGTVSNGATNERGRVAGPRTVQTGEIDGGGKELSSGEPASSTGEGSRPSAVKKQRTPVRKFTNNFHYGTDGNEADNYTPAQRLEGNVSAIEVIAKLFKEGRKATDEEKQILSRFRGWGQIDQLSKFYSVDQMRRDTYGNSPYRRLANAIDTLDPDGKKGVFAGIKRAALSSYYTPTKIASAMNSFLSLAGFKGGTFLDPSMGNGIFEGTLPKDIQERTMITGVELDWLSGQISRALYPDADVRICGFEKSELTPNSQDVVTSNVPFGDIEVNDPTWKNDNSPVKRSAQKRIHNYYAVKMLELTRPGGIVAMMTSPAVMDTQSNQHIRRYIAEQGEFLGAVRLPDNTFQGTGAMADIIYIRKWKDEEDAQKTRENPDYAAREQAFLSSAETTAPNKRNGEKQKVSHNAYYASNRKNMIGDVVAGNQYNDKSFGLHSELTTDQIAKEVEKAVKRIVGDRKGMLFDTTRTSREVKQAVREEYKGDGNWVSTGNLVIQDGKVGVLTATKNEYGEVTRVFEEQPQLAKQKKRIIAMGEVRTAMKELIAGQIDGLSDTKLNMLRAKLKRAYDEFVSKYGKLQDTDNAVVLSDIDGYTLQALEVWKGGKFQGLSDIFTKNTIKPALKLEDAKTPQEAITTSLAEYGEIRGEYIEKALGADWFEQCGDLVFKEPNATDRYVTRDEYLSGDVVAKLEEAKTAAATDPTFERNVKELEQVQPATIPFDDITIHLGARWIPQEVLNDFVKETLGLHASSSRSYEWVDGERREIIKSGVVYVPETDSFEINIEAKELGGQAEDWKTADKSIKEIFQAALEDKDFRIVRKDKDGNTWIDQEATELANSKVADLREHFEQWLPGDDNRIQTMERAYNDRFNRIVLRKWDGSHLNVPGLMGKELRPHQKDAVWMLINNRGGIVDHIVGAGKTLVMQSAIMEMRRMGIAKKPMIVALKSTVPQIAREFKEAYPTARVLAPSEKDFSTENRKKFFANISLNDYDCIIVSHEQYCKIPHSEEAEGDVVNEQLAQLDAMIEYLYGTGDKSQLTKRQIKSLEKRRQNLHAKLEKRLDRSTDREFCFENMGIDYLFVDECHQFKSLPYVTSYQNVAGLGEASGSNKAVALLTGIRHLQKMHQGDKGTVFLSGTTITNSLVEIYNLLNYLRPRKLEQLGMPTFDAWASTFAVHSSELEAGVSNEFKMKDRFRYFDNVPELSQLYAEIADVRNDYNLQLPKPKVDGKTVIVPQSDAVAEINREVVNMLQTKDGSYFGIHPKDPKKFPWGLVASGISAKAAVSPRLVFPEMDDSVGKISYCCDNIKKSYDEMKEQKGVQLVFCELGVPTKGKEYDAYHDIINRLTKDYGIPREEIAYIQQVKNDTEKEALFQKVRDGKVRILIGGTRNMGTGVNVQTRITDLHMLTVPWQPADLEQCIGRGSRQGNVVAHDFLNNKVRVHYYATEGSLDLYKYQLLDAKGKMFTLFKMGTISGERSFDEGDADENGNIDPAQMVALLSGNPIIFEKSKQDKLVKKLKSLYNGFLRDQQRKRQNYETVTKKVENLKRLISLSDSDVHDLQREDFKPDDKGTYPSKVKVTVEGSYYGQNFDKPKEAGQYILEQLKNNKKVVLAGFGQRADVVFVTGDDLLSSHYEVQIGGNNAWSIRYSKRMPQDPTQAGLVFRNLLEQIIHNNEVYHREYDTNSEMLKTMPKGDAPFPKQKELDEAIAKQKELDAEYNKLGQSEEDKTKFRLLDEDDPKAMELESLPESELVPVYRNVQAFEDDALGSPMAFTDAETGERRTLEGRRWNYSAPPKVELTEEQQRKLDELNKNGYIMVDGKKSTELQINDGLKFVKPKTKEAQLQYFLKKNPEDKGLWAAYDPYDHAIETPLNTQFGEAYKRPNLVVVRSLIPKSEIDEPFHADYALLPTGAHQWNNGRTLYLSRWSKIDKVLTREEEAKLIDEYWKKHPGKREELKTHRDYNRFVPQVRRELEKMGYRFELDGKELTPEESLALDKQNWESRDIIPGREGHTPFVSNEDIARINAKMAGKWVGEPKEAMESAMSERVTELSERLHTPVRIIRTEEEVAALPSVRQRRMKGSFNPMTGEVTIVVPNNANMADIENTFVHEVVGHDGLRVLFPDEAKLNNALDELYRVSKDEIRGTIDRMAQKMYDAEVDRIREKKRKEHVANGEDANASYYADMAAAHAEAGKKREQFKRDATEEYGADLAGRIGEKGFEKMSAEELTFWGKLKAMLQKALQKLLDGLKIPGKRKWGDKNWAFVLHEAYKRKKNGGKPTVFDAADTEVMRRKTGFGEMKFSDGKREQKSQVATTIADMKQRVTELFEKAKTGEFVGKPASIGRLSVDGKAYLEKLSDLKFKEFVDFVLNPSDLNHIRSDHYGENEKDKGNNVPLTDEDIQNMVDVLNQPDGILYGVDKKDGRKLFFFLKDAGNGLYNLTEVCSTKKGNLTAKSFFKSKKKGISQRVMEIKDSLLPTSVTYSGEFLSSDAKIPTLFEINEGYSKNVADEGIMFRDGDSVEYNKAMARDIYEQRVSRGMYQTQEALQDSMLGLKEAMDAILKAEGNGKTYIEDVAGYENAYLGENRLSSVNQAECTAFAQTLFKPMLEEVAKLAKTADERAELTDYMMAKHGLERNEVMARRAAEKDARSEFFAEVLAAQQAVDNDPLDQDAIDAFEDVKQRMQDREEELYLINRERDYAGLTALTGMDNVLDAETEAQQMVSDYERDHWVDGLWDKVNAVTKATLQKTYESGLINKATYDDISGMYENYIPLRGFDDKTSDEAYAYLTDKHSAFNAPIKTAKGRKSKADDPFANMEAMAESAIMQGNRNTLVKQKFLNFALNHPSDLVSVSDLWLWHNDVADEWQPINSGDLQGTERIEEDDSPAEVERKMRDFEYAMQQAAKNDPAHFRKQKDNPAIPYRVVESRDLRQHQVLVKRNGRDIILTINGNPRAAQALNGQTNPDNDVSGAIGAIMRLGETINRQLSAFYTTRNPDFVVSNFMRDMMYANTMVWVKESPNYAWRFHKNVAKVNPAKMKVLLAKLRNGTLDLNDETEKMFHLFMMNGGETGYANIRDIEQRKNDIKRELKKSNGQMPIRKAWDLLGERLDEYNRAVENCARFAAFMTSRQLGRTIDRSVYDAKEISVNFNKKGSGAKFWKTNGQTGIGNVAAFTSGLGRSFYVFWNAALQGSTNFGRQFKRHPKKAIAGAAAMFLLGALMASIGGGDGDDDKDDKNDYFNLPEYVRRSNVVFRLPGMDKSWISMPLPVEYRAMYGMGELMVSAMNGKEHYTAGELAHQMASQVSQMLPIDIMEGSGGFKAFVPSAIKPIAEVIGNESWTGMPIYKDTPFNKDMPEWTKAYKSANKYLVGLSKALNEATGGDAYTSGKIDINPAQVEYLLNGIFGGVSSTIDRLTKMGETVIGDREYDPRSFLLLNRLVKNGDERTEYRAVNNEYFRIKEESEKLRTRLNHYENDTADGVFDYAEKIAWLNNSPEYRILETYEDYSGDIDDINEELKAAASDEERKGLEAELNEKKKELVDAVNNIRNGKQQ